MARLTAPGLYEVADASRSTPTATGACQVQQIWGVAAGILLVRIRRFVPSISEPVSPKVASEMFSQCGHVADLADFGAPRMFNRTHDGRIAYVVGQHQFSAV